MKRDDYFYKEKRIIYLKDKIGELRNEMYTPWTPLETPLHRGWEVTWVLRDDIQRRKDVDIIIKALNLVAKPQWCRKISQAVKIKNDPYFHHRWSNNSLCYIWDYYISDDEWESLEPAVRKYYTKRIIYPNDKLRDGSIISRYRLNFPHYWLVPVISKHYITQVRTVRGEIESEMKELENELYRITDDHPWHNYGESSWWTRLENRRSRRKDRMNSKLCLINDEVDFKPRTSVRW